MVDTGLMVKYLNSKNNRHLSGQLDWTTVDIINVNSDGTAKFFNSKLKMFGADACIRNMECGPIDSIKLDRWSRIKLWIFVKRGK